MAQVSMLMLNHFTNLQISEGGKKLKQTHTTISISFPFREGLRKGLFEIELTMEHHQF
jgi:hypothetical protein